MNIELVNCFLVLLYFILKLLNLLRLLGNYTIIIINSILQQYICLLHFSVFRLHLLFYFMVVLVSLLALCLYLPEFFALFSNCVPLFYFNPLHPLHLVQKLLRLLILIVLELLYVPRRALLQALELVLQLHLFNRNLLLFFY